MQQVNFNKTIDFKKDIEDLLLINIDEQIDKIYDEEGIKITGKLIVGGKIKLDEEKEFEDEIDIDIFLMQDEILDRNSFGVSVNDFNYKIEGEKLILDISLKMEGLKEMETDFLSQEDIENVQETLEEDEEKRVYIELDNKEEYIEEYIELEEPQIEEEIIVEEEIKEKPRKSLLKAVFSNKKINEEVSWVLHCTKKEETYETIASKYNININKLKSINNDEKLEEGKLIFLPLE